MPTCTAPRAPRVTLDPREVPGRLDNALAAALAPLLGDAPAREQMAEAMQLLARPHAAWHVAAMIFQMLEADSPLPAAVG